jgi:hypothetical protein
MNCVHAQANEAMTRISEFLFEIQIPNIHSSSQRIFFRPALSLSAHRSSATTRSGSVQDETISRCFG